MARIKNVCHRCRHTWRLKGEHLSSACPKCGSAYVGPAPAGGIGLLGLIVIVGGGLAAAVYLGLIKREDLPAIPEVPGLTEEAPPPPPEPGAKGAAARKAGEKAGQGG